MHTDLAPPDIRTLQAPLNSTSNSCYTSTHLEALLNSPYPPPDKLMDNGTEELQYSHVKKTIGRLFTHRDTLELKAPLPKLACAGCEKRADGYCVQCRLRRFCKGCFLSEHKGASNHSFMEYTTCRDSNKEALMDT